MIIKWRVGCVGEYMYKKDMNNNLAYYVIVAYSGLYDKLRACLKGNGWYNIKYSVGFVGCIVGFMFLLVFVNIKKGNRFNLFNYSVKRRSK